MAAEGEMNNSNINLEENINNYYMNNKYYQTSSNTHVPQMKFLNCASEESEILNKLMPKVTQHRNN
jgi:hypothetical protein